MRKFWLPGWGQKNFTHLASCNESNARAPLQQLLFHFCASLCTILRPFSPLFPHFSHYFFIKCHSNFLFLFFLSSGLPLFLFCNLNFLITLSCFRFCVQDFYYIFFSYSSLRFIYNELYLYLRTFCQVLKLS